MSKIIQFPGMDTTTQASDDQAQNQVSLPALANSLTFVLIQQALDDACTSRDWKDAKRKIAVAVKRGHIRAIK